MLQVRPYRSEDAAALLALFRDTIRRVNASDYGPEEIRAWSSDHIDPAAWAARFTAQFVPVAECGGQIAGFASLEVDGHVDRLYVSADHQRRTRAARSRLMNMAVENLSSFLDGKIINRVN